MRAKRARWSAVFVAIAIAVASVADVYASMVAMACCEKADGECARLRTPDDCCQAMGHVTAGPSSTTPPDRASVSTHGTQAIVSPVSVVIPNFIMEAVKDGRHFKRPHDPPHLHPTPLLI